MTAGSVQNCAYGPVCWHRIADRLYRRKTIAAVGIRGLQSMKGIVVLFRVLAGIQTIGCGLPDIQFGTGDGVAVGICDPAAGQQDLTFIVTFHIAAKGKRR